MRESDTGLWLHNKLGATDELWAPPSIASLLTAAVIDNIRLCFHGLSSAVKLKLLLGTLHLPRRTVDEVRRAAARTPEPGPRGPSRAAASALRSRPSCPRPRGPRPLLGPARAEASGRRPRASASGVSARRGQLARRALATHPFFASFSSVGLASFFFLLNGTLCHFSRKISSSRR